MLILISVKPEIVKLSWNNQFEVGKYSSNFDNYSENINNGKYITYKGFIHYATVSFEQDHPGVHIL